MQETTASDDFRGLWEIERNILAGKGDPVEIADMADMGVSFNTIMKLLIVYSLVNGGMKPKVLNEVKMNLIETFGFQKSLLFHNLEKLSMVRLLVG